MRIPFLDNIVTGFMRGILKTYDFLTSDKLYDALFTLADVWCPSINEYEYKEFFTLIKFRLKYQGMQDSSAYDVLS